MSNILTGFKFTETMGGYVAPGTASFVAGAKRGRVDGESLRFTVTIRIPNLSAFLEDPSHRAEMTGTIDSASLGRGLAVEEGVFNLLERTSEGRLRMGYSLSFHAENGEAYVLEGFKDVHNDRVIDFWYDTTALFTTLRRRDDLEGDPAQTGILRIRIIDLVSQVLSMRNPNGGGLKGQIAGLLRFNWFFSFTLAREYARPPRRNKGAKSS